MRTWQRVKDCGIPFAPFLLLLICKRQGHAMIGHGSKNNTQITILSVWCLVFACLVLCVWISWEGIVELRIQDLLELQLSQDFDSRLLAFMELRQLDHKARFLFPILG